MGGPAREHAVLGRVEWDDRIGSWFADVELVAGCTILFSLSPDTGRADWAVADPAELFEAGAKYLVWARQAEPRVRGWVVDNALERYNRFYANGDPATGRPPMDRAAFMRAIRPCGISFHHSGQASWGYSCGDLFRGEEIWLTLGPNGEFLSEVSFLKWSPPSV